MSKTVFNPSDHFGLAVGFGLFRDIKGHAVFGRSATLDGDVLTDITQIPGLVTYVYPSDDGEPMNVVSTDPLDVGQVYLVEGLDAQFNEISEEVTLNGTTPVPLVNEYSRINALGNVGTTPSAGDVSVTDIGGTVTYSIATARAQQENDGIYTVPAGYSASVLRLINSLQKATGSDDDVTIGLKIRVDRDGSGKPSGVFRIPFDSGTQRSGDSSTEYANDIPEPIQGPADIKLFATSDTGGSVATGRLALLLAKTGVSG